jgi:hypothetical protein
MIGGRVDRTAAGAKKPIRLSPTMESAPVEAAGPTRSTTRGAAMAVSPPATSNGPTRRRGSPRSAALPPAQAPTEIPARITPMIPVKTSRLTPR